MKYKTKGKWGKEIVQVATILKFNHRRALQEIFRQNARYSPIFLPIFLLLTNTNKYKANHAYITASCIRKLYMHIVRFTCLQN